MPPGDNPIAVYCYYYYYYYYYCYMYVSWNALKSSELLAHITWGFLVVSVEIGFA